MSQFVKELAITSNTNSKAKSEYIVKKRYYRKMLQSAKRCYNDHRLINADNKSREIWKIINFSRNKPKNQSQIQINDSSGITISDYSQLACNFADHFQSLSTAKPDSSPNLEAINAIHSKSFFLHHLTKSELKNIVQNLGTKHSSGFDGIPSNIIKLSSDFIMQPLHFLINESFRLGVFPSPLKVSKVIPLYKNKGARHDINSYRPISLLNQFSKIFEKAFYVRLIAYFEATNVLTPSQHGFRKQKSTSSATYQLINQTLNALDNKMEVAAMFFDFTKAFDSVDHQLLLMKLNRMGIRGIPNAWIESYLSDRIQHVVISVNGSTFVSPGKIPIRGVPQGSVLGPVLFLSYINDLVNSFLHINGATPVLYADDTNIVLTAPNFEELTEKCKQVSHTLLTWCHHNFLDLNIGKSHLIYFVNKNKASKVLSIEIDGKVIPQVQNTKFLGFNINFQFCWDEHINTLAGKLSSACYLIRAIRPTVSADVLRGLYYGEFYSHVAYSILFWGSFSKASVIFRIQKRAIRLMTFSKHDASCRPLFKKLDILPVPCIYIFHVLVNTKTNLSQYVKNRDIHHYSTRQTDQLHVLYVRTRNAGAGPHCMGLQLYNKLPAELKALKSVVAFKTNLLMYLKSKMFYSIDEFLNNV
jgi:hypothetical protein